MSGAPPLRMNSRLSWFRVYGHPLLFVVAVLSTVQNLSAGWRDGFPDFEIFYASAGALRHSLDPYTTVLATYGPNANPPLVVFFMQPLSALPYHLAAVIWILLGTLTMLWSISVIRPVVEHGWILLVIVLITQAGILSPRLGQIAWFLMPLGTLVLANAEMRPPPNV